MKWLPKAGFALLAVTAGLLGVAAQGAIQAARVLPRQGYGLCPGFDPRSSDPKTPPLCSWLTELLDRLAGISGRPEPLTFGDLAKKGIEVFVMTTNLTHGRPCRIPFVEAFEDDFFFKEAEFAELFPARVVSVSG